MQVSVIITSHNRCADLQRTLRRLSDCRPQPEEILVTADGCDDDTVTMVQQEFPGHVLIINQERKGSIYSRDQMLRVAKEEIVVSLDDDSYPVDDDFFEQLLTVFTKHEEASVLTFPELRNDERFASASKSKNSPGHYVSAYPNGAAAMKRSDYLSSGGFPTFFIHAYEEPDYALQVYHMGKSVWFEPSLVIRHHYSPVNRNELQTHHFNARNELWSVWMRCAFPWVIFVSLFRVGRQFLHACMVGIPWVIQEPRWWWRAALGFGECVERRDPIPWKTYLNWMRLARRPLFNKSQLERVFESKD
jgi:GT2 family glycosyltransferase